MAHQNRAADNAMLHTLNSALGNLGGGQKSWMASADAAPLPAPSDLTTKAAPFTLRRRGRPPKNPAAQPRPKQPTIEHAQPSVEPHVNRQPPSNSTSPQLANVLTNHDQAPLQSAAVTVFPSPTPSEEDTHNPQPPLDGGHGTMDLDFLPLDSNMAQPSVTPSDTIAMRGGLSQRIPPEEAVAHMEKRRRGAEGAREHQTTTVDAFAQSPLTRPQSTNSSRPVSVPQQGINTQLEPLPTRSPSLAGQSLRTPMQMPQFTHGPEATGNAQARMPGPRRTSSLAGLHKPPNVPTGMNPAQNSGQFTWHTTHHCLHLLSTLQHSPDAKSFRALDWRRLGVLRTAAQAQDWAYLSMHQIYCLLHYNPSLVSAQIKNHNRLDSAVRMLSSVLEPNRDLSPVVLYFCSEFPCSLADARTHSPAAVTQHENMFLSFISHSSNFGHMKQTCMTRRFPPLAWEMRLHLGIFSNTLQRILFTAVLRDLWRPVHNHPQRQQYENQAIEIFKQNQDLLNLRLNRPSYDGYPMDADNQLALQQWGSQLRGVVEELELVAGATSHLQPNPQYIANTIDMASRSHTRSQGIQAAPASFILPSQPPLQTQRKAVPLLPPPGLNQPQQRQPNPMRFSLHQANLRSPILKARSADSPLYQCVQGFIKPPQSLASVEGAVEKWEFNLDAEMMSQIPPILPGLAGDIEERLVDANSKTIRLRCVKWPHPQRYDDHTWATTDTSWIPYSYFSFNGISLTQRKKVHHGKDLPIDITHLVREGGNVLEMTVMSDNKAYLNYLVAIEFLGFTSHEAIRKDCLEKNCLPAHQVLSAIKHKLRSSDDDEVSIVESNLTINLFDPYSASRICDIPVRSRACLHPDCFDLETYLQTRPRNRKGAASVPDLWRCPICKSDARPEHLIVDGFLQQVKQELDAQGLSNTRAIIVQQDGTWKPKAEVREGVSDDLPTPTLRRRSMAAPSEVIDLSD